MHNASDVQSWLYSGSCPHNDIEFLCVAQQGNCYPKQILSPQTICPILQSRQALWARVGGMEDFFAQYRRRLPAGSLFSTITALWGCLTEAKEREQRRQSVWRCLVCWYLFLYHSESLSLLLGMKSILLCLCFLHIQMSPLSNFFLPLFFIPSTPQTVHRGSLVTKVIQRWQHLPIGMLKALLL